MANSSESQIADGRVLQERSFWSQENLVPIIMLSLLATLLGATVAYFYQKTMSSGDEPPIRVKNGSIEFHVLGNDKWKEEKKGTAAAYWEMKNKQTRLYDPIRITAAYDGAVYGGQPCKTTASGDAVIIVFRDDDGTETRVTARTTGKRTRITAATPARLSGEDDKVLQYSGTGYIRRIAVESSSVEQTLCEFENATQLIHLLLLDYQN